MAGTFTALGAVVTMINASDNNGLKLIRLGGSGGVQPHFTNTGTLRLHGTADVLADGNGGGTIIKEGVPGDDSFVASNHVFTNNGTVKSGLGASLPAIVNNTAIFAEDDTTFTLAQLMTKGDAAPGVSGAVFRSFMDPVSGPNQSVAFIGTMLTSAAAGVSAANNLGIWWRDDAGTWSLVARKGAQPPGVPSGTGPAPLPKWKKFRVAGAARGGNRAAFPGEHGGWEQHGAWPRGCDDGE